MCKARHYCEDITPWELKAKPEVQGINATWPSPT